MALSSGLVISPVSRRNLVRLICWIMIGVSLALVLMSVLDRTLPRRTSS